MVRKPILIFGSAAALAAAATLALLALGDRSDANEPAPLRPIARPIELDLPIDCAMPERCVVQFHVDRKPGPAVSDYRCGQRAYDTHRGTDFRVLSPPDFKAGIPVLAAAPGRVIALRDGMDDIDVVELGRSKVEGRAGGNQVVLAHEDGWQTWYWHLRKDSVAVKEGQMVSAGTTLGYVGLSGDTNFPHLHFELRRNRNIIVDPFDASAGDGECRSAPQSLWTKSAMAKLAYVPLVAQVGFVGREISRNDAIYGRVADAGSDANVQTLFLWMELYGLAREDRVSLRWRLPDGTWRAPAQIVWQQDLPYAFRTAQLNVPPPLPRGEYAVRLEVVRAAGNEILIDRTYPVTLR